MLPLLPQAKQQSDSKAAELIKQILNCPNSFCTQRHVDELKSGYHIAKQKPLKMSEVHSAIWAHYVKCGEHQPSAV